MKRIPDPKTVMAIKNLPLMAKTTVDGFMSGINSSRLIGEGVTFSQYRNYLPGDDLRNLDWKVFGRTERYYIRQSETEKNITVHLMVDASASMGHDCGGYSKIQYAAYLTATLALLAYRQGDRVGLSIFNGAGVQRLPPRHHSLQLPRIYHALEQMKASGRIETLENYKQLYHPTDKQLLVVITDFYEHQDELSKLLALLNAQGHETILLHLMAANELEGQFKGYDALEDLETGEVIMLHDATTGKVAVRDGYLETSRKKLRRNQVYYCLVNAADTPEEALMAFLIRRNSASR